MDLFDTLVDDILSRNEDLLTLRPVVEKEVFHQEILREMSEGGFFKDLTFIGGTCLRDCYSSPRLSEDLDFSTSIDIDMELFHRLGETCKEKIAERYGLPVVVTAPEREITDTRTWKIKVITRPEQPHLPSQRIHIDICSVPSFDRRPVMLKDHYGIAAGTSGLILYAESKEEILCDKHIALALRPNRVKQRDLWDILWLDNQSVNINTELTRKKLKAREIPAEEFLEAYKTRLEIIDTDEGHKNFLFELRRFLPQKTVRKDLAKPEYWTVLIDTLQDAYNRLSTDTVS